MPQESDGRFAAEKAAAIVRDAGGKLIGRTRLQKTAYLLELAGLGGGFSFEYRHYGPYSEELADAVQFARLRGSMREEERPTSWGGFYSVYESEQAPDNGNSARKNLIAIAADADPVVLELAATAAFLSLGGERDPWAETERRKPEKAEEGRLAKARDLYRCLCAVSTPQPLPDLG